MKTNRRIRPTKLQADLAALLIADPHITLAEALRRVGYSEAVALHAAKEIVCSPGVQAALADRQGAYRAKIAELLPAEEAAARKVELAMQDEQLGTALNALDGLLEDAGIRESKDEQKFLVLVLTTMREVLVENVPDQAGNILVQIGERFTRRSMADSNRPVLIPAKTPMNLGEDDGKTEQNPAIGQS